MGRMKNAVISPLTFHRIFWHFERWRFLLFSSCCTVSARPFLIPHGLFQLLRHQILMSFHGIRSLWRVRFHLTWQSILRSVQTENVSCIPLRCFSSILLCTQHELNWSIGLVAFVSHHMFRMLCQDKKKFNFSNTSYFRYFQFHYPAYMFCISTAIFKETFSYFMNIRMIFLYSHQSNVWQLK